MSAFLILAGVLVMLYGILRPERTLPNLRSRSSSLGASAIFGLLCVAGAVLLGGPVEPDSEPPRVPMAGTAEVAAEPANGEWPGGESARDGAFRALLALVEAERYAEAQDRAVILAAQPHAAPWYDSLQAIARTAEERALYVQARQIPASAARDNWDAYADLARRFLDSPRHAEYVAKRDVYERRLIEAEAARFTPVRPTEPEATPPESPAADTLAAVAAPPPACCRVCVRGKPCGNTCIARTRECRSPPGCACQG